MNHIHRLILNAAVKSQVGYVAHTFFQTLRNLSKGTRSVVPYMTLSCCLVKDMNAHFNGFFTR